MEGITGIVGPNGCGKSNILDAIQWVMGESRPTSMRSGGMEDIIFAGAGSRAAKSSAEVSLILDNSDFSAPGEFSAEKNIEIVRKLVRDLGSSFKVNGKEYRAKDVQMLFADASSGAQSNALVKQGQVTELINSNPKDRRRILEEAAGISGLYQRRHDAELKLNNTELNVARVSDIVEQLESQIKALERQSRQAKKYKDLGAEISLLEEFLYYLKHKELSEQEGQLEVDLARITTELEKSVSLASSAMKDRQKIEDEIKPLRGSESKVSGELVRFEEKISVMDYQKRLAEDAIDTIQESLKQIEINQAREKSLLEDALAQKQRLDVENDKLSVEASDLEIEERLKSELKSQGLDLSDSEKILEGLGENFARLQERLNAFDLGRKESQEKAQKLRFDLEALNISLQEISSSHQQFSLQLKDDQINLIKRKEELSEAKEILTSYESQNIEALHEMDDVKRELSQTEGKLAFLNAECQNLTSSVAESSKKDNKLVDQLEIQEEHLKAIFSVVSDELEYPEIKEDEDTGWRDIGVAKNLPSLPEGIESLADIISVPEPLLAKFKSVGVVPNDLGSKLQKVLKMGQTLVSKEGKVWRWDGFVKNQNAIRSSSEINIEHKIKLKAVEEKIKEVQALTERLKHSLDDLRKNYQNLQEKKSSSESLVENLKSQIDEFTLEISKSTSELSILDSKKQVIQESISMKKDALNSIFQSDEQEPLRASMMVELEDTKNKYERQKKQLEEIRAEYGKKKTEYDQINLKRVSQESRIAAVKIENEGWTERFVKAQERQLLLQERENSLREELISAEKKPHEIKESRISLEREIKELKIKYQMISGNLQQAEGHLKTCFEEEKKLERLVSDQREKRAIIEANSRNIKERLNQLRIELNEALGLTAEKLEENIIEKPLELKTLKEVEDKIFYLKRRRDSLGAVNLRAEEDTSELMVQYSTLKTEKEDLSQALEKLSAGIADLNKEGRERLKSAFAEVNENFKKLFKDLFDGGDAMLTLVESSDPLEAGIEIFCQPPGKKLSTISLLSGGEQTLTALSLIFAVFKSNPSPICILDEVDAPLDDPNTLKFCELICEMVKDTGTRFLVVTHNSITMSRMDRLLGVTMVEKGVSQLVSVSLQAAEDMIRDNAVG